MITDEQIYILKGYIEAAQDDLKEGAVDEVNGVYPTVIELVNQTFEANEDLKVEEFSADVLSLQAWYKDSTDVEVGLAILEAM